MSVENTSSTYGLDPASREAPSVLATLRRRWLVVVFVTLFAGAAAATLAYLDRNDYTSTAKLLFLQTIGPELRALELLPTTPDADRLAADNVEVVGSQRVAASVAEQLQDLGRNVTAADIEEDVVVAPVKDTDVVAVTASATSARGAAELASRYADTAARIAQEDFSSRAGRVLRSVEAQIAALTSAERAGPPGNRLRARAERAQNLADAGVGSPRIVQTGFVPTSKSGNPLRTILLGVLFGVVLGVGLALLRDQGDRRLHRPEEVSAAFDAPVLTTVPRSRALKKHVRFGNLPVDVAESFRMLQMNLRYARSEPVRSVLVTSSRSGEGKTTIAWNLASAAVTGGLSVALVEADMRRPSLAERYDLEPEPGLTEALQGAITIAEAMQPVLPLGEIESLNGHQRRLQVMVAGGPPVDPWALMQSDAMGRLLNVLKQHHDLVVVDTPPIPHVADAISLLRHVDGVIVTASVNTTKGPDARRLRDQLLGLDARVLGVVANGGTAVDGYGYVPPVQPVASRTNGGRPATASEQPAEPPRSA